MSSGCRSLSFMLEESTRVFDEVLTSGAHPRSRTTHQTLFSMHIRVRLEPHIYPCGQRLRPWKERSHRTLPVIDWKHRTLSCQVWMTVKTWPWLLLTRGTSHVRHPARGVLRGHHHGGGMRHMKITASRSCEHASIQGEDREGGTCASGPVRRHSIERFTSRLALPFVHHIDFLTGRGTRLQAFASCSAPGGGALTAPAFILASTRLTIISFEKEFYYGSTHGQHRTLRTT